MLQESREEPGRNSSFTPLTIISSTVNLSRVYTCSLWNKQQQHSQGQFPWVEDVIDFLEFQQPGSPPVCEAITCDIIIVQLLCASKVNLFLEHQRLVEKPHSRWKWYHWQGKRKSQPCHNRLSACVEGSWQRSGGRSRRRDLGGRKDRPLPAGWVFND